jgi:hypothetical protein
MAQVSTVVITPNGAQDQQQLTAQIDDRPTGYNGGKTQFSWGEDVYIALYHDGREQTITFGVTGGTMTKVAENQTINASDVLQFVESAEANTSKPVVTLSSMTWFGGSPSQRTARASGGNIVLSYTGTGTPPALGVYIGKASYQTKANFYKLTLPAKPSNADADYQVMIWFKAE